MEVEEMEVWLTLNTSYHKPELIAPDQDCF